MRDKGYWSLHGHDEVGRGARDRHRRHRGDASELPRTLRGCRVGPDGNTTGLSHGERVRGRVGEILYLDVAIMVVMKKEIHRLWHSQRGSTTTFSPQYHTIILAS